MSSSSPCPLAALPLHLGSTVFSFLLGFLAYTRLRPVFSRFVALVVCFLFLYLGLVPGGCWVTLDYPLGPAHLFFSIKPLAEGFYG
jgi:hypothetical protein